MLGIILNGTNETLVARKNDAITLFEQLLNTAELVSTETFEGKADLGYATVHWHHKSPIAKYWVTFRDYPDPEYFEDLATVLEFLLRKFW